MTPAPIRQLRLDTTLGIKAHASFPGTVRAATNGRGGGAPPSAEATRNRTFMCKTKGQDH